MGRSLVIVIYMFHIVIHIISLTVEVNLEKTQKLFEDTLTTLALL